MRLAGVPPRLPLRQHKVSIRGVLVGRPAVYCFSSLRSCFEGYTRLDKTVGSPLIRIIDSDIDAAAGIPVTILRTAGHLIGTHIVGHRDVATASGIVVVNNHVIISAAKDRMSAK